MISIIVCSVNAELRESLLRNIKATIGYPFEFLFADNSIANRGICSVYNELALQAKGDFLCFCHEDVEIKTPNWGTILAEHARKPEVGVIGFAGSATLTGFSYWDDRYTYRANCAQGNKETGIIQYNKVNPNEESFSKVLLLDGVFLFVRKPIWEEIRFDEKTFNRFHFYDIDFSCSCARISQNYVCNVVDIVHYSLGNINYSYYEEMLIFNRKWEASIPSAIVSLSEDDWKKVYKSSSLGTLRCLIFLCGLDITSSLQYVRKIYNKNTVYLFLQTIRFKAEYATGLYKIMYKRFRSK